MNPDDQTLLLWLEDELTGEERTAVDAWAVHQPTWLEKRESSRRWRNDLNQIMSHRDEIPHGEFFQARLMQTIAMSASSSSASRKAVSHQRKWTLPVSIAAAMVLGFWGGTQWHDRTHRAKTLVTYTPEAGVKAEYFETSPADGTVIVLNGVDALPDEFVETSTSSAPSQDPNHASETPKRASTLIAP